MAAVDALLLGSLVYRSGLVARVIPLMGLIGGPLLLASVAGVVLGTHDLDAGLHVIAAAPIFSWELSPGVYLMVKGFRSTPITARAVPSTRPGPGDDIRSPASCRSSRGTSCSPTATTSTPPRRSPSP
ncbi:hypothetical protein JOD57_004923 [Geodermatophilus bullaregiensis]|nr:hypothetical protein [Geodermatophilus bullaregiensis]